MFEKVRTSKVIVFKKVKKGSRGTDHRRSMSIIIDPMESEEKTKKSKGYGYIV